MRYLHTMLRVRNLDVALKFYSDALGLKEVRRVDNDKGRFTLVFLCAAEDLDTLKKLPNTRGAPLVDRHRHQVGAELDRAGIRLELADQHAQQGRIVRAGRSQLAGRCGQAGVERGKGERLRGHVVMVTAPACGAPALGRMRSSRDGSGRWQ